MRLKVPREEAEKHRGHQPLHKLSFCVERKRWQQRQLEMGEWDQKQQARCHNGMTAYAGDEVGKSLITEQGWRIKGGEKEVRMNWACHLCCKSLCSVPHHHLHLPTDWEVCGIFLPLKETWWTHKRIVCYKYCLCLGGDLGPYEVVVDKLPVTLNKSVEIKTEQFPSVGLRKASYRKIEPM